MYLQRRKDIMLVITVPGQPPANDEERAKLVQAALPERPVDIKRAFRGKYVAVVVGKIGEEGVVVSLSVLHGAVVTQDTHPLRFTLQVKECRPGQVVKGAVVGGPTPTGAIRSQNPISYV